MREECFLSPPGVSSGSAIFNSILVRDEDVAKSKQVPCRESPPTGEDCRACYKLEQRQQRYTFKSFFPLCVQREQNHLKEHTF